MNQSVIFDTNAYREFTYGKSIEDCIEQIDILKSKEASCGNTSFMSPYILLELGAHLSDDKDKAYKNCQAAFISCYNHCKIEGSDNFRMIPDAESHVAKILFDYQDQIILDKWTAIGQLAYKMSKDYSENSINIYRHHFLEIDNFVNKVEEQFVTDMLQFVVKELNPKAEDWNPLKDDKKRKQLYLKEINTDVPINYFALAQVVKASDFAKEILDNHDLFALVDAVKNNFPAPLYLYRNIFKRIIETGIDLTSSKRKRWNWIWDIQILFSISSTTLASKKTLLVTSDKDVITAANDANLSNMIIPLNKYLTEVGFK